ncbi:metalloregulator ArsR/SmtB family transcription factor [Methanocorpusculum sp. MG]|uniref:Metalloregulator ArsR/SmtB family transcription factor n=1 Tax=Methanocorpusculum petauri TaxID=3002863 RepID=A0ABT4IJ53_9EURY|nr:metalloregulator ArsR/SmtB family transcription factor [Methanocorpusculum petauri]MCZ0861409.1 metalloregulator ArsR/SmtB family transcription factor [Methanocorpusculum petauri]MCZ9312465.1 metalloregulator ArsR/SmtB family transcription factor [Methanocorpusculum sp.]
MTEQIFKALSDSTRLRMVSLVMKRELCVCEIMGVLNLSQSNASRHLTILKNAGVLSGRRQAQWAYYKISEMLPQELYQYLSRTFFEDPLYAEDRKRLETCNAAEGCKYTTTEEQS